MDLYVVSTLIISANVRTKEEHGDMENIKIRP